MTIIETFLVVLPLISFACHPAHPSRRRSSSDSGSGSRVAHNGNHYWQGYEGEPAKNSHKLEGTLTHQSKNVHLPKTSRTVDATTEVSPELPECQQCTSPPQSNVTECEKAGCQPAQTRMRIVDECSVAELKCPDGALSFGIRSTDGKHQDHGLDEIGLARCSSGVWNVETATGDRSISNIVCNI